MGWWYYYCMHGPGHQSTSDHFFEMEDGATDEDVRQYIEDHYVGDKDSPVTHFWPVTKLSQNFISDRIKGTKRYIASLRAEIKESKAELEVLRSQSGKDFGKSVPGYDRDVMIALSKRHTESVLELLHKEGITVNSSELYGWENGHSVPDAKIRRQVISCGKRAKKYLSSSYINNKSKTETLAEWKTATQKIVERRIQRIEEKNAWIKEKQAREAETVTI